MTRSPLWFPLALPLVASSIFCDNTTSSTGYLEAGPGAEYFYWLVASRHGSGPLILWTSGALEDVHKAKDDGWSWMLIHSGHAARERALQAHQGARSSLECAAASGWQAKNREESLELD